MTIQLSFEGFLGVIELPVGIHGLKNEKSPCLTTKTPCMKNKLIYTAIILNIFTCSLFADDWGGLFELVSTVVISIAITCGLVYGFYVYKILKGNIFMKIGCSLVGFILVSIGVVEVFSHWFIHDSFIRTMIEVRSQSHQIQKQEFHSPYGSDEFGINAK